MLRKSLFEGRLSGPYIFLAKLVDCCYYCCLEKDIQARSSGGEHYLDVVGVQGSNPCAPSFFLPEFLSVFGVELRNSAYEFSNREVFQWAEKGSRWAEEGSL